MSFPLRPFAAFLVLAALATSTRAQTPQLAHAFNAPPLFAGAAPAPQRHGNSKEIDKAPPGQFDFYLLTLSWSPEFCRTNPTNSECTSHPGFLVHGLWPQDNNGSYPAFCGTAPGPTNTTPLQGVMPDGLITHEWPKHGTCSGLTASAYVAAIVKGFRSVSLPAAINDLHSQKTFAPADILSDFATANSSFPRGSVVVACSSNRLTAVEVCLDKSLQPIACQQVPSCTAPRITVTPR